MRPCTALAWMAALLLALSGARPARAVSIEVIEQGPGEFYVGLVLESDESVAGIQLEIVADGGNILAIGPTAWDVPLTSGLGSILVNPWTLTSGVAERGGYPGAVLVAHTFNQRGDVTAALTSDLDAIIDRALGVFAAFRDPAFQPTSLPIAQITVDAGTVVAVPRYRGGAYPYVGFWDAICIPGRDSTCELMIPGDDADADGVTRVQDNCPDMPNSEQQDRDHDGVGDACNDADDRDGDDWADALDVCVTDFDFEQADTDRDGTGDACNDPDDRDDDEWADWLDNCPKSYNPDQNDDDANGQGNACDSAGVRPRPGAWAFTSIAETGGGLSEIGAASLNDAGTVAFPATLGAAGGDPEGYAVFTGAGASLQTITTSPLASKRVIQTRINAAGLVALEFVPLPAFASGSLIFTGVGGDLQPRARVGSFVRDVDLGALGDAGELALLRQTDTPGQHIRRLGAAPLIGAVLYASDSVSERGAFRDIVLGDALDDGGRIAFLATHDDGRRGIFRGDGVRSAAIATDGATPGSAARFLEFPTWELPLATGPAMNGRGTVAFVAIASCPCIGNDTPRAGLFASRVPIDSTLRFKRSVIAFGAPFLAFVGGPSLGDGGEVAFQAILDDGTRAIFAGGHPTADRVIQVGEELAGSAVIDLELHHQAVNPSGQIAFTATLADGRRVIYRADPLRDPRDPDGDGLDAHEERRLGTDPANPDSDGDLHLDAADNCPSWPNRGQGDQDMNATGDTCECGDQTGDGTVDILDAYALSRAIVELEPFGALCDTNDDGLCNVADILGVNAKLFGQPAYCARFPAP